MRTVYSIMILASCALLCSGCTSVSATRSPQFYPNEHYRKAGVEQAHHDTRYCMSLADQYVVEPDHFADGAKSTAKASVAGAAAGAVTGAILNSGAVGRYTAAGAASAAIFAILGELYKSGEKSPSWERFVEKCLFDKGYNIYDWR